MGCASWGNAGCVLANAVLVCHMVWPTSTGRPQQPATASEYWPPARPRPAAGHPLAAFAGLDATGTADRAVRYAQALKARLLRAAQHSGRALGALCFAALKGARFASSLCFKSIGFLPLALASSHVTWCT